MVEDTSRTELHYDSSLLRVHVWTRKAGAILGRWWEQPIGIIVPLVALVILALAPQSADMFAAIDDGLSVTFFAAAASSLAFSSWYWTRAGLRVLQGKVDSAVDHASGRKRLEKKVEAWTDEDYEEWSDEWAPRATFLFCLAIAATPLLAPMFGSLFTGTAPFFPSLASVVALTVVATVYFLIVKRRSETAKRFYAWMRRLFGLGDRSARERGEHRWSWETTSVLAAAPFGPWVASMALAVSVLGIVVVSRFPQLVDHIDAPAAALLALALLIPVLVLALAFIRDLVRLVATLAIFGWDRWIRQQKVEWGRVWKQCTSRKLRGLTANVGLLILAGIIFTPYFWAGQRGLYEIRTARLPAEANSKEGQDPNEVLEQSRPTVEEALEHWRQARLDAGHPHDKPLPAIIVAASGGASRAAFWLLSSMQMLDEKTKEAFGRYLFAVSGVSGSSLGAVTYLQMLRQFPKTVESDSGPIAVGVEWASVREKLTGFQQSDFLVASISTYFLNDAVRPILQVVGISDLVRLPDRGEALERAFERHWADPTRLAIDKDRADSDEAGSGLIKLWQDGGRGMPHLLLNGTDVDSGRRLITSTMRFTIEDDVFPNSDDLLTLLRHDVPASTAITNSARFPFISPAGRFWVDDRPRQVADGGYFENYGARTAVELADKVKQLSLKMEDEARKAGQSVAPIVPILVVVSNDAEALRSADEVESCRSNGEDDCRSLKEASVSCDRSTPPSPEEKQWRSSDEAQRAAIARDPRGGGFGPEFLAPLLGLNATRGAHGQDALHIIRRYYCPVEAVNGARLPEEASQQTASIGDRLRRMIHIALPRPKPENEESAPLNWVLNESAIKFLRDASGLTADGKQADFNRYQAETLNYTLDALLDGEAAPPAALASRGGK